MDQAQFIEALRHCQPQTDLSASSPVRAAVALVLRETPPNALELLLIERATDPRDPWSGHTAFPGGREEPGDASLEDTARRETLEEVGLPLEAAQRIGRLDDVVAGRRQGRMMSVSPFVFFHPHAPDEFVCSAEVARALWLPLDILLDRRNVCPYAPPPPHSQTIYPSFQFNHCTIWGISYSMLCNLGRVYSNYELRITNDE